jgi:hypothetical protein
MVTGILWLFLCTLVLAMRTMAREPRSCAEPSSYFRNYHQIVGTDDEGNRTTVYDEISVCRTGSGLLSFALRIAGEGGDPCYLEGQANRGNRVSLFS